MGHEQDNDASVCKKLTTNNEESRDSDDVTKSKKIQVSKQLKNIMMMKAWRKTLRIMKMKIKMSLKTMNMGWHHA